MCSQVGWAGHRGCWGNLIRASWTSPNPPSPGSQARTPEPSVLPAKGGSEETTVQFSQGRALARSQGPAQAVGTSGVCLSTCTQFLVGGHRGDMPAGPSLSLLVGDRGTRPSHAWGSSCTGLCPICQPDSPRPLPTLRKNRACFELEIGGVSRSMLLRHRL